MSKSKPRLNVLIKVCRHIQNEVLIHLVPKVLEPNKIVLPFSQKKKKIFNKALTEFKNLATNSNFETHSHATQKDTARGQAPRGHL